MAKASRVTSKRMEDLRANMQPLSDKCKQEEGCAHINGEVCKVYAFPESKWRIGNCVMATNVVTEAEKKQTAKKRVGQQKQKKRR